VRIFIDANILFSAANRTSATHVLFNGAAQHAELVTNSHAWEEAYRNLLHKKPEHAAGMKELMKHIELSPAFSTIGKTDLPDEDVPILAGAVGAQCSHIWTSDKRHFGRWYGKRIRGISIVSSVLLADILAGKGRKYYL
jgi:predicted nucleic acid-binding protein